VRLRGLGRPPREASIQNRPEASAENRPALHQTTTPATLPFQLVEDPEFCVLLTVSEVTARLRVSQAAIYGLVKRGGLPSLRVSNSIRIRRDDVDALVR
jgi:excisionase family DNA binding protein